MAAEITASAFRIAPERPLLGRVLNEEDERAGAAPVAVLGHRVWLGPHAASHGVTVEKVIEDLIDRVPVP